MLTIQQGQQARVGGLTIAEHAARAAESVRAISQLSARPQRARSLTYPQDVWQVVHELHAAAGDLALALAQIDDALSATAAIGRVCGLDHDELGGRPLAALGCVDQAAALAASLRRARDYTGSLSYDVVPDWSA